MSLDVWFKDDIRNMLVAVDHANAAACANLAAGAGRSDTATVYRAGYVDALRAVAAAFGIPASLELRQPLTLNPSLHLDLTEVANDNHVSGP